MSNLSPLKKYEAKFKNGQFSPKLRSPDSLLRSGKVTFEEDVLFVNKNNCGIAK